MAATQGFNTGSCCTQQSSLFLPIQLRSSVLAVGGQVGVVEVGRPFPFWVRGQALLTLQVAAAAPAAVVRLTRGAEVAVAPRPRARPQQHAGLPSGALAEAAGKALAAGPSAPCAWLRLQARCSAPLLHS
jgi:hypothetical protein